MRGAMSDGLLIDECLTPELVGIAHEQGFEAYHVAHYGMSGATDCVVFEEVSNRGFVFVTNNRDDFIDLVETADLHAGLIVIVPQVRRETQKELFQLALTRLKEIGDLTNKVLEIDEDGRIQIYDLPTSYHSRARPAARAGSR
jgi:predicted nuclease of predicted toxin-antitoxin system